VQRTEITGKSKLKGTEITDFKTNNFKGPNYNHFNDCFSQCV